MKNLVLSPDDFVFAQGHELKTDSLKVAKAFGREHKNILRAVDDVIASIPHDFAALNFELADFIDKNGDARRCYNMTKDGFMFLVMGFTGDKAVAIKIAYINAFNHMARSIAELNDDLLEKFVRALEAEKQSFAMASLAGRLLRRRRDEKHTNQQAIEHYKSELQPLLNNFETFEPA